MEIAMTRKGDLILKTGVFSCGLCFAEVLNLSSFLMTIIGI